MKQTRLPCHLTNAAVPFALALILCAGSPALARNSTDVEQTGVGTITVEPLPDRTGAAPSARDVLAAEIARMDAEIATMARFAAWQEKLLQAAKSDPVAALTQRLPMSECRASPLAPVCHRMTALFAPDGETDGAEGTGAAGATDIEKEPR